MIAIIRRLTQALFLLLFLWLFLQTESRGENILGYPVKIFLDADPLIFITTVFSSRSFYQPFLWVLLVVIATMIFGRVFCGWVCPLGTLHNVVGGFKKRQGTPLANHWYQFKYYLLIFILFSSLFSLQLAGIADPISLLIRSLSLAVYPAFQFGISGLFDTIYSSGIDFIINPSEFIYGLVKKGFLSFQQPLFFQSVFIGAIFILILALNLWERRFWCKYLCPLGALLGILSRYALLHRSVSEGCNSCGVCAHTCQGAANCEGKDLWRKNECLACMNCDDICPNNAVRFGFSLKKPAVAMDLGKRRIIASMVSGILAVPLLRITPLSRTGAADPRLIRPPGALEEKIFLRKCVKCGECMKVCLTNGLQPTLWEAGVEGIWSPMLVPRIGYCEYRCTLCGQVCPTGAIQKLSLEEKANIKIGLAMIDESRCLPYAHGQSCIVCEEVCPTPKKAIWFEPARYRNREGKLLTLKQPHVDLELCIGCGICEARCPILGRPAIAVTSLGESRSKDNQLLLE